MTERRIDTRFIHAALKDPNFRRAVRIAMNSKNLYKRWAERGVTFIIEYFDSLQQT